MSTSTGIILNGVMDDFCIPYQNSSSYGIPASKLNRIAPRKQMLSSISPSLFVDKATGEVRLAIGASGGPRITTSLAAVVIRTLLFNETIKEAIDPPRLHHQLFPNKVFYETNLRSDLIESLHKKGHASEQFTETIVSSVIAIARDSNGIGMTACFDQRKNGSVAGF